MRKRNDMAFSQKTGTLSVAALFVFLGILAIHTVGDISENSGAEAATIVVDKQGGGDYTRIQSAIDNASANDTILVKPGTYNESIIIDRSISLVGSGSKNTVIDGGWNVDVVVVNSDNVVVSDIWVTNGDTGILINNVSNVTVRDVKTSSTEIGIFVYKGGHNTLFNNTCLSWRYSGIMLAGAGNNILHNNTLNHNGIYGILLESSSYNMLADNTFIGSRLHLSPWRCHDYIDKNTIEASNKVGGKPIIYWKDVNGMTVPAGAGQVILLNCSNVTVENQTMNNLGGITSHHSKDITLRNNDISNGTVGIWLTNSYNLIVRNNTCNNNDRNGILLEWCTSSTVENNTCSGNGQSGIASGGEHYACFEDFWDSWGKGPSNINIRNNICDSNGYSGVSFSIFGVKYGPGGTITDMGDNEIFWNSCTGNDFGVSLRGYINGLVHNNTIVNSTRKGMTAETTYNSEIRDNLIRGSQSCGIYLYRINDTAIIRNELSGSPGAGIEMDKKAHTNDIYLNNFINNTDQAVLNGTTLTFTSLPSMNITNRWNTSDGRGNYWSDYAGMDNGAGTRTASDGIGDTLIPHAGVDNYPLMSPVNITLASTPSDTEYQEDISELLQSILLFPADSSPIDSNSVRLSWSLDNVTIQSISSVDDISFDIYLDTTGTPAHLYRSSVNETELEVTGLEENTTYYWTVIPKLGLIHGSCSSGVWSFTTASDAVFGIRLEAPTDVYIHAGDDSAIIVNLTNIGTDTDEFAISFDNGGLTGDVEPDIEGTVIISTGDTLGFTVSFSIPDHSLPGVYNVTITADSLGARELGLNISEEVVISVHVLPADTAIIDGGGDGSDDGASWLEENWVIAVSAGITGVTVIILTAPIWYVGLLFFFAPLMVRARKAKGGQKWRAKIYSAVVSKPGVHFVALKKWLEVPSGTLVYNLKVLEKDGQITSRWDGSRKKFFPEKTELYVKPPISMSVKEKIAIIVRDNPGIGQSEVSGILDESWHKVHYHVKGMKSDGIIDFRKGENGHPTLYLADGKAARALKEKILGRTLPTGTGKRALRESSPAVNDGL